MPLNATVERDTWFHSGIFHFSQQVSSCWGHVFIQPAQPTAVPMTVQAEVYTNQLDSFLHMSNNECLDVLVLSDFVDNSEKPNAATPLYELYILRQSGNLSDSQLVIFVPSPLLPDPPFNFCDLWHICLWNIDYFWYLCETFVDLLSVRVWLYYSTVIEVLLLKEEFPDKTRQDKTRQHKTRQDKTSGERGEEQAFVHRGSSGLNHVVIMESVTELAKESSITFLNNIDIT